MFFRRLGAAAILSTAVCSQALVNGWQLLRLRAPGVFANPDQFALRISTSDNPNNSVTEAGFDAFRVDDVICSEAAWSTYGNDCSNGASAPTLTLVSLPAIEFGTLWTLSNGALGELR